MNQEKINDEIRKFLNITTNRNQYPILEDEIKTGNKTNELLKVIKEFNKIYENQRYIQDSDKIDNSKLNIKIINIIREILKEQKELEQQISEKDKIIENLENKHCIEKNDYAYDKATRNELKIKLRDQKMRMNGIKQHNQTLKAINDELSVTNEGYKKRIDVMENELCLYHEYFDKTKNEISQISAVLSKQQEMIKKHNLQLNEKQGKYQKLTKTVNEKNQIIENLNSELSKLIIKEKSDHVNYKERANYYEKMNQSLGKQNDFLKQQLSKMVTNDNIDIIKRDSELNKYHIPKYGEDNFKTPMKYNMEDTEKYANKSSDFKDKYKKNKRYFEKKLNEHIRKIEKKEKLNELLTANIDEKDSVIVDYERKIDELKEKNRRISDNYETLNKKLFEKMEGLIDENKQKQEEISQLKLQNIALRKDPVNFTGLIKNKDENLINFYSEKINDESFKSIMDQPDIKVPSPIEDHDYNDELKQLRDFVNNDKFTKYLMTNNQEKFKDDEKNNFIIKEDPSEALFNNIDSDSTPILMNYDKNEKDEGNLSTTSSLRNMIAKTDSLKKKFDDLEIKLGNIKNNRGVLSEEIKEKLKGYDDYYFADLDDIKNDPNVF